MLEAAASWLDGHISSTGDLDQASALVDRLRLEKADLLLQQREVRQRLLEAAQNAEKGAAAAMTAAERLAQSCKNAHDEIALARTTTSSNRLTTLANETAAVDGARIYVDSALHAESLIHAIEANFGSDLGASVQAYAELVEHTQHASWPRMRIALQAQLQRLLQVLKKSLLSEFRGLLSTVGWPPDLGEAGASAAHSIEGPSGEGLQACFQALSTLQVVSGADGTLWGVAELVAALVPRLHYHFKKWAGRPELLYALALKTAKQNAASLERALQPLLAELKAPIPSVRMDFVNAMGSIIGDHLRSEMLPTLADKGRAAWLHAVDEALDFDNILSSTAHAGLTAGASTSLGSAIRVFAEEPHLQAWCKFEWEAAKSQVMEIMVDSSAWQPLAKSDSDAFDDVAWVEYKPPRCAEQVTQLLRSIAERCAAVPSASSRLQFVQSTTQPLLSSFIERLGYRCNEEEARTALSDTSSLISVAMCINAAHYIQHFLSDWSEQVFCASLQHHLQQVTTSANSDAVSSLFGKDTEFLTEFQEEWSGKLAAAMVRGFDARSSGYRRKKSRWSVPSEDAAKPINMTTELFEALEVLQQQLGALAESLDEELFTQLWRRVAELVDASIFEGLVLKATFSLLGAEQLELDMSAVFSVLSPYCSRPQAFFPMLRDACTILQLPVAAVAELADASTTDELRKHGILRMSLEQARKVVANRA
eukprot:jgi/Chlat1/220/Chrsp1S03040